MDRKPAVRRSGSASQVEREEISSTKEENDQNDDNLQQHQQEQQCNDTITPHMERLLRLIRQGSADMVEAAVDQLYDSCCNHKTTSAILQWRVLGRLQGTLCAGDSSWKARSQTAQALERIAQLVPRADQDQFWRQQQDHDNKDETAKPDNDRAITTFLTLDQVETPQFWSELIQHGRLLYVTAASKWEEDQLAYEQEVLKEITEHKSQDGGSEEENVVQRRTTWQRQQLAQRLGLNALVVAQQDVRYLAEEEAAAIGNQQRDSDEDTSKRGKRSKGRKRQRSEKSRGGKKQRRKSRSKHGDGDDADESNNPNSVMIQNLLVVEMQKSLQKSNSGGSKSHAKSTLASQLNPQQLLATEFVYRMLDPSWQVRHGALLGLLALVRAWHPSLLNQQQSASVQLLPWPQDLLIRAMAILVLDRFGDFSGAFAEQGSVDGGALSFHFYQGGAVAPIRETAGQLVALLFTLFPSEDVQPRILNVLQHCILAAAPPPNSATHSGTSSSAAPSSAAPEEDLWEVRQGVLATFKYVVVLLWQNLEREQALRLHAVEEKSESLSPLPSGGSSSSLDSVQQVLSRVANIAVEHLGDLGDDVVSVSAQVLREMTRSITQSPAVLGFGNPNDNSLDAFIDSKETMSSLYQALQRVQSFSSCIPDLVALLSELLESKSRFCSELASAHNVEDIFRLLSGYLDSDYESVQVSVLSSMASLSTVIDSASLRSHKQHHQHAPLGGADTGTGSRGNLCATCSQIMHRLFQFMMDLVTKPDKQEQQPTLALLQLEQTWKQLCMAFASTVLAGSGDAFLTLEKDLYLSFLHQPVMYKSCDYYNAIDKACGMLAVFSKANQENFPSNTLGFVLDVAALSPWIAHCEAACVLFQCLGAVAKETAVFHGHTCLVAVVMEEPLCLSTRLSQGSFNKLSDPGIVKLCSDAATRAVDMVWRGSSRESAMDCVGVVWNQIFGVQGVVTAEDGDSNAAPAIDVVRMRLRALASGAILCHSLPEKITPYVRSLMSSLKSETCEKRLQRTVHAIVSLLGAIDSVPSLAGAYSKILKTLCDTAISESRGLTQVESNDAASKGLRVAVRQTPINRLQDQSHPIWTWLRVLVATETSQTEETLAAVHLVWVLCFDAPITGEISQFFASKFIESLVRLCLHHETDEIRAAAGSAIRCICSSKSNEALRETLVALVGRMDQNADEPVHVRRCLLIGTIVEVSGPTLRPFVRSMLPIIMKLMRDRNPECSSTATKAFSILVQIAPLVRLEDSVPICHSVDDPHTTAVIDHLILGKPVPPCELPNCVQSALQEAGVSLRPYQEEGISWLNFLQSVHLNGALCDSMGLGKTLQALVSIALAHSASASSEKMSLIVCPSTLVGHWMSEVARFFPGRLVFRPIALVGAAKSRIQKWQSLPQDCNMIVTSYSVLRSDIDRLETREWRCFVLDEGHLLKNPKTATARASRRINSCHKTILSGTIIQNRVDDLWAVFDFLMPNFLGASKDFHKQYGRAIAKSHSSGATAQDIRDGMERLKSLHQKVLPFILRREKEQVLKDLPPKNVMLLRCQMSPAQASIYRAFSSSTEMKKSIRALQLALENQTGEGNRSVGSDVLRTLFFLRLLCTHPALVATKGKDNGGPTNVALRDSGKLMALVDLLRQIGIKEDVPVGADNDTSLLYCEEETEDQDDFGLVVDTPSFVPISHQPKPEVEDVSKCLVFAQFSQSLDIVENALLKPYMASIGYLRLDGRVDSSRRFTIAERFNSDPTVRILLLTTRVGSLGLNLTGADTVIFLEHDWNPFVDLQAMDRAHRIGQTKRVNVYRLVMDETIEERIMELQRKKTEMNEAVVNTDNSSLFSLGTDRLLDIFTVEKQSDANTDGACEFDLDGLLEKYGEDYASSLSVSEFLRKSQPHSNG